MSFPFPAKRGVPRYAARGWVLGRWPSRGVDERARPSRAKEYARRDPGTSSAPCAWAAAPGAAVRPETTSGGTIARRLLSRSPPKWTGGQNRERDPEKRSSGAD